MRRAAAFALLSAVPLLAAGCSSPSSHFYTLSATPGAATAPAAAAPPVPAPSELAVSVGPVSIPGSVDRPQFVVTTGPNQVRLDEFNRWAAPLQNDIARVVSENLTAMLGTPHVTVAPQGLTVPDLRVGIDVQSFDMALGEAATLDAVWTVTRVRDAKSKTGRVTVREPASGSYDALAAAHSRALVRLSQDVAAAIREIGNSPP